MVIGSICRKAFAVLLSNNVAVNDWDFILMVIFGVAKVSLAFIVVLMSCFLAQEKELSSKAEIKNNKNFTDLIML